MKIREEASSPISHTGGKMIDDCKVIFLLENHTSSQDFTKIQRVIDNYYAEENDLILLEAPSSLSREQLLQRERKRGRERHALFIGKKIAGWDHEMVDQWSEKLKKNKDVLSINNAISCLRNKKEKRNHSLLIDALDLNRETKEETPSCSVDALDLASPHYTSGIQRHLTLLTAIYKKIYGARPTIDSFRKVRNALIKSGFQALAQLENRTIEITFPMRQASLLSAIRHCTQRTLDPRGKIFVIAGKNHMNHDLLNKKIRNEVIKLQRALENFTTFVVID